jgi:hypothetical protein
MHNLDAPAIARVLSFQALKRAELPTDVQTMYPEATGGMACVSRYLKSGRGAEVLEGIKEGIAYQMSFGYKALDAKARTLPDGRKVRVIKELRLYEVSTTPPGHAANDATRVRLGKTLAVLEELKAGWRHGTHADKTMLLQIRALINDLLGTPEPQVEPAPPALPARTSTVDALLSEVGSIYEVANHVSLRGET